TKEQVKDLGPGHDQQHGSRAHYQSISQRITEKTVEFLKIAFGKKPLAARRGGSIPIISTFEQVLGVKTILMGFGLESNAIHSPNENFDLEVFKNGIVAVTEFYRNYTK
ncbi:MAG: M20/M25/M40 family metallo-hydrolase, partial [Paludibacteraceae bacterium]|nr:M20/M25/M40 family metallo-hydrolase [Paludibacteraceae bacterium]